ncbi:mitochondrial endodeoxyribonuclease Pnu1 [Schizosaccharomyces pombe]|uniref:Nuclease 1, mitochondrial n=1 Tax=Schizosaccharomyces pombe (strain 972 / ATCC 24843) TaxID=284812 RepID=PNU1_SCHPO|nr:endodeoxyribonuclease Pnu1 [Schizosaccharomyces pombe]Q10480.2 RecName: Full=Nuclease 1, mitochondrial; AltName: Full=SpNUC1; Flags: Precursor [Schizosaccharomyces pombe 972h-]BAB20882.1 mitochondrial nuclease [Schizosaccharomyces pombe]CAA97354.2 mitochondrial endodeoxyribonuclease Pnu1 [Schizosaccharomyces pombe]|eukprot:NP_594598.2 endodeoxyribonuclease Pnu1 [Schizosaccharomyces pombe]
MSSNLIKSFGLIAIGAISGVTFTHFYYKGYQGSDVPDLTPRYTKFDSAGRALESIYDFNATKFFQYGIPGPVADQRVNHGYMSVFDRRTRNPFYTAETITQESLNQRKGNRRYSEFVPDDNIPEMFQAKLGDYRGSGYDRGHQVPAADCKFSQEAMNETFYLSNMCPQVGDGFNRNYWAYFEDWCRRLTSKYGSVTIMTGPLYLPKKNERGQWEVQYRVIGNPPNVAVPTHFFKVIIAEKSGEPTSSPSVAAFVLPNKPIADNFPLKNFAVPVEVVERASGLEILSNVPKGNRKQLCSEVVCQLNVKEFVESVKQKQKNQGK